MWNLRLDRAISVGLIHPVSLLLNGQGGVRVPILMYHGISRKIAGGHPYFETNTTPELFARHMRFLHENGYATVDLNQTLQAIMTGRNGRKLVAITFDDGLYNFYTHALPILNEYGLKATLFIVSERTKHERVRLDGEEYLGWREVREVHSCGIRIGSHTVSHPELYQLSSEDVEYEIRQSKEAIEDQLGEPIRSFSYPYAFPEQDKCFLSMLRDLLQTHGYEQGVSTILGRAGSEHDWFFLPRLPVNSYDDLRFLRAKLEGAYDWLHTFQLASKLMTSLTHRGMTRYSNL